MEDKYTKLMKECLKDGAVLGNPMERISQSLIGIALFLARFPEIDEENFNEE